MTFRTVVFAALFAPVMAGAQTAHPELKVYESCQFPDGLTVAEVQPMPADVHERPVQVRTAQGEVTKQVPLLAGRRITFAYPGADPYASVKLELLPAENYAANRTLLLQDFDDIIASDKGVAKNTTKPPKISGFSVVGLDRKTITGNTLGIYLLLDDAAHVAETVYLLNPKTGGPKTGAEYGQKRDTFLYNYTRCVRNNQNGVLFGGNSQ